MIRQNRLLGYTWNPEQKKDYEDLYQSWSASDMAAEIVNLNILQSLALAREAALQERKLELETVVKSMLAYIQNAPVSPRSNYEEYAALRDAASLALREDEP